MDTERFTSLTRVLGSRSRRGFFALATSTAGALAALPDPGGLAAKKKGKKKKKKLSLKLAYECAGPPLNVGTFLTVTRVAQVFSAERGGTLRRIQFLVDNHEDDTGDYVVQLLRVDDGTPLSAPTQILAGLAIPEGDVPLGESMLTANFNGPRLEDGVEYAAAIGRVTTHVRLGTFGGTGNVCAGETFTAQGGAFAVSPGMDVVVSVFVD
jgi:hypothetical protein